MSVLSSDMQEMLANTASKFVASEYAFEQRMKLAKSANGFSDTNWQQFAEFGWLSIPFVEKYGGLGGSIVDMASLVEQFGYGLVLEPYFSSVVLAGQAIAKSDNTKLQEQLIPAIACGERILSLAWEENNSGCNPLQIETTATAKGQGYEINGEKSLVLAAPQADGFVVSAKNGECTDLALFYVPAKSEGITLNNYSLVDGSRAGTLVLNRVNVGEDAVLAVNASEILHDVIDGGIYLLCCEALGCMEKLLQTTADYMNTRKQFGVTIGTFQALRHKLADMFVILKKTRCLNESCAAELRNAGTLDPERLAALKVQTGLAAHFVGRQSIQIHGGIGMTDELDVGHYVKRLTSIDALFGNTRYHLQYIADQL